MASEGPASATAASGPGAEGETADPTVGPDAGSGPVRPDTVDAATPGPDPGPVEDAPTGEAGTDGAGNTGESADPGIPEEPELCVGGPWAVVAVYDIGVDLPATHARVTLREVAEPYRILAIPIGLPEGTALAHAWRGVATPRPLTHELFSEVLARLGATIEVVRLTGRRAGVILAEMELSGPRGREVVQCRPTDGVTLSVRQGVPAPILVDLRLFEPEGDVDPDR